MPFDTEESSGVVYLWIGSNASPDDVRLAEEIGDEMFNSVSKEKYTYKRF